MRTRFYDAHVSVDTDDGKKRVITVVGKVVQGKKPVYYEEDVKVTADNGKEVDGKISYKVPRFWRKLTIGYSICAPEDGFDAEKRISIAKSRIEDGEDIGSVETRDMQMLTHDQVMGTLLMKMAFIKENIEKFLPQER